MTVGIILATYNGAAFLREQLASITGQDRTDWHLWISDDGSTDHTRQISEDFARSHPMRVTRLTGPGQGSAANFLSALDHLPPDLSALAFCDQDDVWHPRKLSAALAQLAPAKGPAAYCGRRRVCDAQLRPIGLTPRARRAPSFANALVQNILSGNVAVLNRSAIELIQAGDWQGSIHHDWWIYQMITGAKGQVIYDPQSYILYRQHGDNCIGAAHGAAAWYQRFRRLQDRGFAAGLADQDRILLRNAHLIAPKNLALLRDWASIRQDPNSDPFGPIPVYRQSALGQLALRGALAMGWLGSNPSPRYGSRNASWDLYKGRIK